MCICIVVIGDFVQGFFCLFWGFVFFCWWLGFGLVLGFFVCGVFFGGGSFCLVASLDKGKILWRH